jgi:hypothetical protein
MNKEVAENPLYKLQTTKGMEPDDGQDQQKWHLETITTTAAAAAAHNLINS